MAVEKLHTKKHLQRRFFEYINKITAGGCVLCPFALPRYHRAKNGLERAKKMDTKELAFELHDFIEKLDINKEIKIKIHNKIIDTMIKLIAIDIMHKVTKEDE